MKESALYEYSRKYLPFKWLNKLGVKNVNKNNITDFFAECILPVLLAFGTSIFTYFLKFFPDKIPFYIVYLVLIASYTWLVGLKGGLILTGLVGIDVFLFLKSPDLLIRLIFFLGGSTFLSYVVDRASQMSVVKKLRQREKLYAQSYVKLQDDFTKAQEEIKARDEFLSIASHELKTPLTTMLLKLHNMLNSVKSVALANFSVQELMAVLNNAEQQIKWLTAMINDLLNVSLIATGRMTLEREEVDLSSVTKQVLENFNELLKSNNYVVNIEAKSSVVGDWDKTRIEQAITNLLSNAIKYGKGKPIDIKIIKNDNTGSFIIQDRGIGIQTSEQKLLFHRFKRGENSNGYGRGLGVGLYLTAQIIKAHGGTIKLVSRPNSGSTFSLELPLTKIKKA